MAFEELKEHTEDIQKQAKEYIENSLAYYKLWGFKVAMKSTTMMLKFALIAMSLMMVLLFCSIAGAFFIGEALDSTALGFLIVGGVYLVFSGLLFLVKDKIVEGPILEKFSEIFFND
ncbi:competence protein [Flavobacterium nackdongense]|uniref:Competence protein n=1 Tax=Flavobacterium nackdongense TaxID=2547394 RepID=A0A4P6Y8Q8_9FLAO|nr:competence protein [Flavobacterium nackdongense]QBN19271.1 competence protein [Flavobacterium nackdongense]